MPDHEQPATDVVIAARATAGELRFEARPQVRTRFPGRGQRANRQTTTRRNITSPVEPGKTYRHVFAATRISSRLLDGRE